MVCKEKPSHDLHNISGEYHYEIDDWMWVCRSCHQKIHKSGSWMKNVWNSEKSLQRKIALGNRSRGNKWAEGNSHPPWNKGTRKISA
jgi:hypothetical protein